MTTRSFITLSMINVATATLTANLNEWVELVLFVVAFSISLYESVRWVYHLLYVPCSTPITLWFLCFYMAMPCYNSGINYTNILLRESFLLFMWLYIYVCKGLDFQDLGEIARRKGCPGH